MLLTSICWIFIKSFMEREIINLHLARQLKFYFKVASWLFVLPPTEKPEIPAGLLFTVE